MHYPLIRKARNLHWMVLLKYAAVSQTCDTAVYHFSIGSFISSHNQRRVCALLHIISLWRALVSAIKTSLNWLHPLKFLPLHTLSSCAMVWNCMTCKGQWHKIWPCHRSKLNKSEFWKLTHFIGAPFINPSSTHLHLKLLQNMSLKFFIDINLLPHYGLGIDSASNWNKYQEYCQGRKGCHWVRLTLPLHVLNVSKSWSLNLLEILGSVTGLYRGCITILFTVCLEWIRKIMKDLNQNSQRLGWDSKQASPKYLSGMLTLHHLVHTKRKTKEHMTQNKRALYSITCSFAMYTSMHNGNVSVTGLKLADSSRTSCFFWRTGRKNVNTEP